MIDHIDMEIINCLKNNSRMQWKQIGEMVHMSGVAVANWIKLLEDILEYGHYKLNVSIGQYK
ncbi:AsnC family transcriptional regulator [Neobacillus mesonae]|nr:AsnC family transcriptional regulator [Neobacillus mesonae]